MDGSFTVLVDKDVTIHSLVIGYGGSDIRLTVDTGVTFTVIGSLDILCPSFTVLGKLIVSTVEWSGQYLIGSSSVGSSGISKGQVIVSNLLLVHQGLYSQKYLSDIIITNQKNFTVGTSMDYDNQYIYCQYCQVINEKNATMLINGVQLHLNHRPSQSDSDGFGAGIINEGCVVSTSANSYSTRYLYWDLRNNGTVKVLNLRYQRSSYVRFRGRVVNNGLIQFYMTIIYLERTVWILPSNGSWEIYGYPYRSPNIPEPIGQGQQWQWNEFLTDVYQNISADLWDPSSSASVHLHNLYDGGEFHFNNLTAFGRVEFQSYQVQSTNIYFSRGLHLGHLGEMQLQQYSSSTNDNNRLVVGESGAGDFDVSLATIGGGWTLEVCSGSAVKTYKRLVIDEVGQFIVQPGKKRVHLSKFVGLKSAGLLRISGRRNCTVNGDIYVKGTLDISNSTLGVTSEFQFSQGSVVGQSSQLYIYKLGNVSSNLGKTVDGIGVHIKRPLQIPNGIVEYFQYRVDTPLTSKMLTISYFPSGSSSNYYTLPPEFDDPATEPNMAEFVDRLDRRNQYYGNSPIAVTSTFGWFDTVSPDSFTFNYAARMWTFLQIDQQGSYTFFFDSGYGMRVRLWINDVVVFTGSLYSYLVSDRGTAGPYTLSPGLNRLRIDFIQRWNSGNALIVTYSGPSFNDSLLPQDKMFGRKKFANGTVEYANPRFNITKFLPFESTLKVGGKGLILAKNGASVIVDKTGVLEVTDDITWFSHTSFGIKSKIVNSGKVIKTGDDGVATFFADYIFKRWLSHII